MSSTAYGRNYRPYFTLAGTGVTVGKIIRSLKNAPNELLSLANEISDLEVLFHEIQRIQGDLESKLVESYGHFE